MQQIDDFFVALPVLVAPNQQPSAQSSIHLVRIAPKERFVCKISQIFTALYRYVPISSVRDIFYFVFLQELKLPTT
jgi:hypothetical protein